MKKMSIITVFGVAVLFGSLGVVSVQSEETVNIGFIGPLTGGVSVVGVDMLDGVKVGAAQINARGGLNIAGKRYLVNVVAYDDEAKPDKTVAGARKLVSLDKVHAIVGPPLSSCALALLAINEKLGVVLSCIALHPDIVKKGNKLVFRSQIPLSMMAEGLANTVMDKTTDRKFSIIHHTDDWGIGWKTEVASVIEKKGGKIVSVEGIDERTQSDFYTQLTKIIAEKPDAIFIIAHDNASILMIKQVRELGYTGRLIFSEGFRDRGRETVGYDKLEGCMWGGLPWDFRTPEVLRFIEEYRKHLKKEPVLNYSPAGYESFIILAHGMEKAGTVSDPYKIRAAIPQVIPYPESIFRIYGMEENGQAKVKPFVGIVEGGKPKLLQY